MTKALLKNTFREIAHTKARFLSIMAIIALGVGFFAGIKSTSPSMYRLAERYYRESQLMDFRLVSTAGFAEEDIAAVMAMRGVKSVMPSYFCDAMTSSDDGGDVVRIIAVPKACKGNRKLNTLTYTEGRAPKKSGEIVTESVAFANIRHKIGAVVTFQSTAGDNALSELLKTDTFTVVGKAESPLFISYQRGTSNLGDGRVDEYMYISAEDFNIPCYNELYIKADFSDEVSAFSDSYKTLAEQMKAALREFADQRELAFTTEVVPHARQRLEEARSEYNGKKAEAEQKLGEALTELESGEATYNGKIAEAQSKLNEAQEQLDSGEAALEEGKSTYASAIASAESMIAEGRAQLTAAQQQLEAGRATLQTQLEASAAALEDGDAYAAIQNEVTDAVGSAKLGAAQAEIAAGNARLVAGESELAAQRVSGSLKLQTARTQLNSLRRTLNSSRAELETKKQSGAEQLAEARSQYEAAEAQAREKLAEGQRQLDDGAAAIEKMSGLTSEWYVFTRDDNPGYPTFSQNADRLDAVASVFPLFFLLVAVLVCVTTMTRLIEEKRTEIATLKALGYGNGAIILKYVIYSMIAAVTGSVIGIAAGVSTLPFIIYNAYKIMFYIGDIELVLHIPSIVMGTLAAVCCTAAVSVVVCVKSLSIKPAQAMRPKAPKPGKRILLERVKPLWKRMGFTAKLTARNLFRYKARLCMTVLGVAGCTALIVAAFGLKNSFVPLTREQFGEIFRYDAAVIPKQGGSPEELQYLKDLAADTGKVSASMLSLQEDVTVSRGSRHTTESTYIAVPESAEQMQGLISLHTRKGKVPLELTDDTVLLNEKLAADFGVKKGDTVKLTTESGTVTAEVGGVYEHYIYNFVYMTPRCYERFFGKAPAFNLYQVRFNDKGEGKAFSEEMLTDKRVVAVAFTDQNVKDFRNMLNSLDMVVLVMIICAAALAFVVLYNLTNINLAERQREIATFKVLGFYNRETTRFITIENVILTLLGILVGLGLGVLLSGFIIRTVEVDNVMFGRDIYPSTYLYASGLTMLFSLLVNLATAYKIRKVNMVESLKSVE